MDDEDKVRRLEQVTDNVVDAIAAASYMIVGGLMLLGVSISCTAGFAVTLVKGRFSWWYLPVNWITLFVMPLLGAILLILIGIIQFISINKQRLRRYY